MSLGCLLLTTACILGHNQNEAGRRSPSIVQRSPALFALKDHFLCCSLSMLCAVFPSLSPLKKTQMKFTLHFPFKTYTAKCIITGCNYVLIQLVQHIKGLSLSVLLLYITIHEGKQQRNEGLGKGAVYFLSRNGGEERYIVG